MGRSLRIISIYEFVQQRRPSKSRSFLFICFFPPLIYVLGEEVGLLMTGATDTVNKEKEALKEPVL